MCIGVLSFLYGDLKEQEKGLGGFGSGTFLFSGAETLCFGIV